MVAALVSPRNDVTATPDEVGRERLTEIQRARIIAAMSELVYEGGFAGVTVAHVVARSGVSRRTFYEIFEDRDDCLLVAFDHALGQAAAVTLPVYEAAAGASWEERLRAGLAALLGFLDGDPVSASLCVVGALAASPAVLARRARAIDALVGVVHEGSRADQRGRGARRRSRIVAEGAVGAVVGVLYARLSVREERPLAGLLNELMAMIVLPYLGPEAAERELAHSVPRRRRPPQPNGDPLRELDMRLTYRTVRVLGAIAQRPASSGRQVAEASGVHDQGQISKLLWRLEHLGLLVNGAPGYSRGEPNAWSLTPKGHEVERALRVQRAG
jgi:AcrR family transcriptional regulator